MCSSSQTSLRVKTAPTDLCDTCKLVVNAIKPFVDSEADEKEIKSVLDTVCGLLPGNFSSVSQPGHFLITFHMALIPLRNALVL